MVDYCEELSGAVSLSNLTSLVDVQSGVQNIRYLKSVEYGRVLVIDDELQHVEAWAPLYHEVVTHLPCAFMPEPKYVLIMGGGSLFAAEEFLKYPSIERIDLVDHDLRVISATLDVYPERKFVAEDKRLNIIEGKCEFFLQETQNHYDVILNDCFDFFSFNSKNKIDYYELAEMRLSQQGIFSDLVYRSVYDQELSMNAIRRIPANVNKANSLVAVPEYPGFMHLLTMWGKNKNLHQNQKELLNKQQLLIAEQGQFKFYDPGQMSFYLYLPPYIQGYFR